MKHLELLYQRFPALEACRADVEKAVEALVAMHRRGGKVLLAGNGGSCADCEHISGELLKGFLLSRPVPEEALPGVPHELRAGLQGGIAALPLASFTALGTAFANDVAPENVFAQLVLALGRPGDVFLGISTSGHARNVGNAAKVAKSLGLCTVALTGEGGGLLSSLSDIAIRVPERETFRVQEMHLPVYHAICAQVEEMIFGEK